jgi:hypothetical protein
VPVGDLSPDVGNPLRAVTATNVVTECDNDGGVDGAMVDLSLATKTQIRARIPRGDQGATGES